MKIKREIVEAVLDHDDEPMNVNEDHFNMKCPCCGKYTLAFKHRLLEYRCLNPDCDYVLEV